MKAYKFFLNWKSDLRNILSIYENKTYEGVSFLSTEDARTAEDDTMNNKSQERGLLGVMRRGILEKDNQDIIALVEGDITT